MPAIITGLVTTGAPGSSYALSGTGFGFADPNSKVYMFPDKNGNIIECFVDVWTPISILGTLPGVLKAGVVAFLYAQLVNEDLGSRSPTFTVQPRVVVQQPSFTLAQKVITNSDSAVDVFFVPIPRNPLTGPIGKVSATFFGSKDVDFSDDPLDPTQPTTTHQEIGRAHV